ncbi:MAG: hypothetical protein IJJ69_07740 [Oscillospiraceae bacterium]|nr:hypothetical protein [Oscillospiraceae bacterium]
MLKQILSSQTCAECRQCCIFDCYDVWNTPVIVPELRMKIQKILPDAEFVSAGTASYRFRLCPDGDSFACPLLHPETGCLLGEEKPFDCQIFPFRMMHLQDSIVIAVSPLCDALTQYSLKTLLDFVKTELAEKLFIYAEQHPDVVHVYDPLYPVLLWKPVKF